MADAQQYRVTVTNEFRSITSANRILDSLSVPQDGDGIVAPLTKEQLAEVKADRYLTVKRVSAATADAAAERKAAKEAADALAASNLANAKAANSPETDPAVQSPAGEANTTPAAPDKA